jgi:hypothetical protein
MIVDWELKIVSEEEFGEVWSSGVVRVSEW